MERVLESPEKGFLESWKTLEFGLCKSRNILEKHFNVCTNPEFKYVSGSLFTYQGVHPKYTISVIYITCECLLAVMLE